MVGSGVSNAALRDRPDPGIDLAEHNARMFQRPDVARYYARAPLKPCEFVLFLRYLPTFDPGLNGEPPDERLARYVEAWIGDRASVRAIATSIDGTNVLVDLGADGTPAGLEALRRVALEAVEGAERVEIRLLPLTVLDVEPDLLTPPSLD